MEMLPAFIITQEYYLYSDKSVLHTRNAVGNIDWSSRNKRGVNSFDTAITRVCLSNITHNIPDGVQMLKKLHLALQCKRSHI